MGREKKLALTNWLIVQATERSTKILDGATTADLAEIEQIVKERMVSLLNKVIGFLSVITFIPTPMCVCVYIC